ncbi:hypothetical protein [Lysobacter gummosus]|uniref:hypothetical protein n=1 Tax=Lysobacter gummosus TaxID=262324 RepID=UPI00362B54BD
MPGPFCTEGSSEKYQPSFVANVYVTELFGLTRLGSFVSFSRSPPPPPLMVRRLPLQNIERSKST